MYQRIYYLFEMKINPLCAKSMNNWSDSTSKGKNQRMSEDTSGEISQTNHWRVWNFHDILEKYTNRRSYQWDIFKYVCFFSYLYSGVLCCLRSKKKIGKILQFPLPVMVIRFVTNKCKNCEAFMSAFCIFYTE